MPSVYGVNQNLYFYESLVRLYTKKVSAHLSTILKEEKIKQNRVPLWVVISHYFEDDLQDIINVSSGVLMFEPMSIPSPRTMTNNLIPLNEPPSATSINSVPIVSTTAKVVFYISLALFITYLLFIIIKKVINSYMSLDLKKTYKREKKEFHPAISIPLLKSRVMYEKI